MEKKKVKLERDIGAAKKGEVYVQGLHELPDSFKIPGRIPKNYRHWGEDFLWWLEGSAREDNKFLPTTALQQEIINQHES